MNLITEPYRGLLRAMHAQERWGHRGQKYADAFMPLYRELGCTSLLDYGSGSETLRQALAPDIDVACYDPAVEGREALPEPADFVACTDVLEHVEPDLIDNVISHICSLTIKGAYLNIGLTKAKRLLPDGRNAHLIIEPAPWWLPRLDLPGWRIDRYEAGQKRLRVWLIKC